MSASVPWVALLLLLSFLSLLEATPQREAKRYVASIEKVNEAQLKKPGTMIEDELVQKVPRSAVTSLARLLKAPRSQEVSAALLQCGEAALDLAAMDHFQRIRKRLVEIDPEKAEQLGRALARDRFLLRGLGELEPGYLESFADVVDAVLDAYQEVFAFKEWSKVPGKKIRIRIHLEDQITRPPHFAPQFRYHSEIDFPVLDAAEFRSPTSKGHMMFYGLCHELGHLIAMWGDRRHEEDHHAWAHYTGVVIVEHMASQEKYRKLLSNLRDVKWRSLSLERKKAANQVEPSTRNREGVMALFLALHDLIGPRAIGAALNHMDEKEMGHRINQVRYYRFRDLKKALLKTASPQFQKQINHIL